MDEGKEALRWKKFPVLDQGFVTLVDWMGDDAAVCQAARVSYGKGTRKTSDDRTLIRYLMRHRHTTPFEMCEVKLLVRVPMDCWRQWIRHRTACLSGDTLLHFDLPGGIRRRGNQLNTLSVKEVYDRFQPTTNTRRPDMQGNPFYKKDRAQAMSLRSLDEETELVRHTQIVDIWESGEKPVWEVAFEGNSVRASRDHLFLTNKGWIKLGDATVLNGDGQCFIKTGIEFAWIGPGVGSGMDISFNPIDPDTESWDPIVGWEDYYEISNQGRVRRTVGGRGSRSFGRCKVLTVSEGRAVVSLNRPGFQVTRLVHQLMMEAFVGPCPDGMEICHEDGNGLNNLLENLRYDTPASNASDRVRDGATTRLAMRHVVPRIMPAGRVMTYDLEVVGPWHNFSAGGFVVHNSVNEYSTRYSEAIDARQCTAPDAWRLQSASNKQGSSGSVSEWTQEWGELTRAVPAECTPGEHLTAEEAGFHRSADRVYRERLALGVAREQARKDLPLSTYTEAYWKCDLHNIFHFLSLRMDSHAQQEIRSYADIIGNEIIAKLYPLCWEAFRDYRLDAVTFSGPEFAVLRDMASANGWFRNTTPASFVALPGREQDELNAKLARLT